MDKHLRPYVCEEHECKSKRLGFTYSGGLTRHQKEVHGRLGGARGKCWCPHVGCKRNGGAGFSRRENLIEHLRRVHKGFPGSDEAVKSQSPAVAGGAAELGSGKKRQRTQQDEGLAQEASSSQTTSSNKQKKKKKRRRRFVEDDEEEEEEEEESVAAGSATEAAAVGKGRPSLQKQISRLKQDMKDKEERITKLEKKVEKLSTSTQ